MCSVCGLSSSDHPQRATHGAPHLRSPTLWTWHTGSYLLRPPIRRHQSMKAAIKDDLAAALLLTCSAVDSCAQPEPERNKARAALHRRRSSRTGLIRWKPAAALQKNEPGISTEWKALPLSRSDVLCCVGVPLRAQRQRPGPLLNIQRGDTSRKMQTKIQGGLAVTAAYVSARTDVKHRASKTRQNGNITTRDHTLLFYPLFPLASTRGVKNKNIIFGLGNLLIFAFACLKKRLSSGVKEVIVKAGEYQGVRDIWRQSFIRQDAGKRSFHGVPRTTELLCKESAVSQTRSKKRKTHKVMFSSSQNLV